MKKKSVALLVSMLMFLSLVSSAFATPVRDQDVTTSFMKQMRKNLAVLAYYCLNADNIAECGFFFADKVKSGGPWDYKRSFGYGPYIFNNLNARGEDLGNMHYGYVGRAAFPSWMLRTAAGAYQIYSGTSHIGWYDSYFDDPTDQWWINYGIDLLDRFPRSLALHPSISLLSEQEKRDIEKEVKVNKEKIKQLQTK
ncbi:polymorphic domain RNase protein [Paenibacillus phage Norbert]|uniref:Bacterial toxin n=6 Tax=Fernvirus jacopo TaxID=2845738 RepID=A0A345KQL9_9CAUD|nr:bacterial toxin 44 [Paenibacillus phage Jacopo]AXF40074.1 bacterial toxin 44 [Paenibacillus phage Bloom]AXF40433.1 bacterial toxin 44 [Paenibacillus phage Genki]AXF42300.1 bacterial toxin 44 [Paenibacillus phage Gryphonian]AXH45321.1 bacterial toxin [Paenibacillus phage Arcticfreeze]AXH45387.1 bacterial toxin [Paenibacillus phage DevRi]QVV19471.1 polymorphic domain RNase protein [Paenibacillus phage Bert]QVV19740.1 polymorphic domain RNase protein [Paenibacillus phage Hobie]QVV19872.1 po